MTATILLLGMPGGWEWIIIVAVLIIPAVIWLWAIIDLITHEFKDSNMKIVWALIIILVPFIGSILYLIMNKQYKVAK